MLAKKLKVILCLVLGAIPIPSMSAVDPAPHGDSMFYYKIGGSRPIFFSPADPETTLNVMFSAHLKGIGLDCEKFDPKVAMKNSMDSLKQGVDDAITQLQNAAEASIAALPGLMLMKATPEKYQHFFNQLLRYEQKFRVSTKTCEKMLHEYSNGHNPFDDLVRVSAVGKWKASMGVGGIDVNDMKEKIVDDPGKGGIVWIGGKKAGCNDPDDGCAPIEPTKDVAGAGAKILSGKDINSDDDEKFGVDKPITRVFESPQEMRDWIDYVFGDLIICTDQSCKKGSRPGKGLAAYIEDEAGDIKENIIDIMNNYSDKDDGPSRTNLAEISAPNLMVTKQLLDGIRYAEPSMRGIFIDRLSTEVANLRAIERSLVLRRSLTTGYMEPNIYEIKDFLKSIPKSIKAIDKELENLLYERNIRKAFVGDVAKDILELRASSILAADKENQLVPRDHYLFRNNRVLSQ